MTTKKIIFFTVSEPGHDLAAVTSAHWPVMKTGFFYECSGCPSVHSRCRHRNPVNAAGFYGNISTDIFEAFAPEQLTCSGNVCDVGESIIITRWTFHKRCACDSETGEF